MSALIRDRQLVQDDFQFLPDDAALPGSGKIIVSLARWEKEAETLRNSPLLVGVRIPNTVDVSSIWPSIADRPLINLEFPGFADGRAYSQARILRERYRFEGELRATGAAVVQDQIHHMHRCGINAFELREDQDPNGCLRAFEDFRSAYQPAADGSSSVFALRSRQAA